LGPAIRKAITEAIAGLVAINQRDRPRSRLAWRWGPGAAACRADRDAALVYQVEQVYLNHAETGSAGARDRASPRRMPT
jgi:hypothetical protein